MTTTIAGSGRNSAATHARIAGDASAHVYTSADLKRIADALGGACRSGNAWKARCCCHPDKTPSLTLGIGDDGRLLWHCHAGCDPLDVRDGLKKRGLLMNGETHEPRPAKARVSAIYPYVDEQGALLYEKLRYQPKRFVQRKPDGNGGHAYKLGYVRRVLYRLPEVLAAEEVIVCEGEKDSDRLRSLGFVATTNVEGASEDGKKPKWREEYSAQLKGKRLVFLPDNDGSGRKLGRMACLSRTDRPG